MVYDVCKLDTCGAAIPNPDIRAAVTGDTRCYAGHANRLYHPEEALIDLLTEMQSKIDDLRSNVSALENQVRDLELLHDR